MSKHFTYPTGPIHWFASPKDFSGDYNLGLYSQESTQRYIFGTRYLTWDGRVFKYAHACEDLAEMKHGVHSGGYLTTRKGTDCIITDTVRVGTFHIPLTVTAATLKPYNSLFGGTSGVIAEDELAGGYVSLYGAATDRQQRMIVGNSKLAADGTSMDIYVDAPIAVEMAAAVQMEIIGNPYHSIQHSHGDQFSSILGMPCVLATSGNNFWIQTYGICRISPPTAFGGTADDRQLVFDNQGAARSMIAAHTAGNTGQQMCGFLIEHTATGENASAAPFIMLQVSI